MSTNLRIAICGTGSFGANRARAFAGLANVELAGGWSRSAARRERFAADHGTRAFATAEQLCELDETDAPNENGNGEVSS